MNSPVLKRVTIRYNDLDPYGHVNNAVYLEFFGSPTGAPSLTSWALKSSRLATCSLRPGT
jgi:acyl-ACP thioesterase